MVAETVARVAGAIPNERIWVVTHRDQAEGIRAAIPGVPAAQILAEPQAKNTTACVALAAAVIGARDPDATLVMMPADHDIRPQSEFTKSILAACESVEKHGGLMVFGIKPTYPATGYGYIHRGEELHESRGIPVRKVLGFREKPNAATAAEFLATGEYLWNSGIFVWKAKRIHDAVREYESEIGEAIDGVVRALDPRIRGSSATPRPRSSPPRMPRFRRSRSTSESSSARTTCASSRSAIAGATSARGMRSTIS